MDKKTLKSGFVQAAKIIPLWILLNIALYLAADVGAPALGLGSGSGLRPADYFIRAGTAYAVIGGAILAWILGTYLYINTTVRRTAKHICKNSLGIATIMAIAIGVSPAAVAGAVEASFAVFLGAWGVFSALALLWLLWREAQEFLRNNPS